MNVQEILELDRRHVWHPYSSLPARLDPLVVESASGVRLRLAEPAFGHDELIDGMSSWWSAIHGYRHPALDAAAVAQIGRMSHVMFGGLTHEPAVGLARRLATITPEGLEHVFLCDSGSVAVEVAVKMCLQFWQARGENRRTRLLTWRGGYYGDTLNPMSLCDPDGGMHRLWTGILPRQVFAEAPPDGFVVAPDPGYVGHLADLVARHRKELAAIVVEPVVQGAGGMRFHSPGYLSALREIADANDVLLVFDEIATGFGRTGALFAADHAGVSPDVMCVGKAMTGGYVSMAATLCTAGVAATISAGDVPVLAHGPTFMGNPLAATIANASIDLLLAGPWRDEVRRIEAGLKASLAPAARVGRRPRGACPRGHRRRPARGRRRRGPRDAGRAGTGRVAAAVPRPRVHHAALRGDGRGDRPDRPRGRGRGRGLVRDRGMSTTGLGWLPSALDDLRDRDLLRSLTSSGGAAGAEAEIEGVTHLVLSSNNYLGLASDERVVAAARAALETYGAGTGASRLVTGTLDLHDRLEERLAALKSCEDALVFPTGFQANVGTIPALVGQGDVVFADELNHASLIDGCRLSRAEIVRYAHADAGALEAAIGSRPGRRSDERWLIVTDTIFSMDGDVAPLPEIVRIAERHDAMLMVDEAHATGVLGPTGAGALEHFGLEGRVPVVMGTLSKAVGSQGGFVAGSSDLCDYLRTRDRSFVFTTGLAPAACGAALAALDVIRDEPERRVRLRALTKRLVAGAESLGYSALPTDSAIVGLVIGEAADALSAAAELRRARVWAPAIRPPSVPPGTARLRLTVMATHDDRHLDWALEALATARGAIAGAVGH